MTLFVMGILLIAAGTVLSGYVADFKKDERATIDKSKLVAEVTEQKHKMNELRNMWHSKYNDSQYALSQIQAKYLEKPDILSKKEEEHRNQVYKQDSNFRNEYNQNIKVKLKTIKKDCEIYLKIYKSSTTSYAEYDRVYGFYDLDKLISDLTYLEIKLKSE